MNCLRAIDGLIIGAHDYSDHLLTDGALGVTPKTLRELMKTLRRIAEAVEREM